MDSDEIAIKLIVLLRLSEDDSIEEVTESQKKGTAWKDEFLLYDSDNHLHIVTVEKVP